MNSKQRQTLAAIFAHPTRNNIRWADAVKLFIAIGATIQEREGSAVAFVTKTTLGIYHKPHPSSEIPEASVRAMRRQLKEAGVQP
jgi:hypothetical protein